MTAARSASSAHRWGRMIVAFSLAASLVAIPADPAFAVTDTYRDNFDAGFLGDDGTASWATDWMETGEGDGAIDGAIVVGTEGNCPGGGSDPCLMIGKGGPGDVAVEREVDLSRASTASLEFDVELHKHGSGDGTIELLVSNNGGTDWTVLQTWDLALDSGLEHLSYDLVGHLSATTRIKFEQLGGTSDSHMNIDNLVITAENDLSVHAGGIVINEVLHHQLPLDQEQFVELFNATASTVSLAGWELWTVTSNSFYTFPGGAALAPQEYAIIWMMTHDPGGVRDAPTAAFQDGAGQPSNFLQKNGDALWLYDDSGLRVDFIAWGTGIASSPPEWDDTYETSIGIASASPGQSISLTPNGVDGNDSACWEPTTSGDASGRCAGYLPTADIPPAGQLWTPGVSNQGPPNNLPVFDQDLPDRSDSEGTLISISSGATDPDLTDTLTYTATGLPQGISLNPATGALTGALGPKSSGTHPVTITVTDDGIPTEQDVDTFTWTVSVGEIAYLVANSGGANGGDDLLTAVDLTDPNPATNEVDIGTGTGTWNIEGIALQPGTDTLFAIENDQLGTIDITSGVFTALPSIVGSGNGPVGLVTFDSIESLSFDPFNGNLYGTHRRGSFNEDVLFQINPVTGTVVPGVFGGVDYVPVQHQGAYYHFGDLAFDPTDGQLYGIHWDLSWPASIAIIDPETGTTSTIGSIPSYVAGLAFDEAGGLWGTTADTPGPYFLYEFDKTDASVISTATIDDGGNYEAIAISFPSDPNLPPAFNQDLLNRADAEGSTISIAAGATDPDIGDVLRYAATSLPPGLTIHASSGLITGTITYAASGTYAVEITVTDDGIPNLQHTDTLTWTVNDTNQPPAFDQDLLDRTDAEGDAISLSAGATDLDVGGDLLFAAAGLPGGLSIDPGTGIISGALAFASSGTHPVTITVTDDGSPNLADVDTFTWAVNDTNRPPVIVHPGAQTGPELAPFSLLITASDPDLTIPSFADGGTLPGWATLLDNLDGTATISGTPGGGDSATTTVTITADDGGLSDGAVFDLTVTNTNLPPVIVNPGNQAGAEDESFSVTITASDPDTTIPTFTGSGLPGWATFTDNGDGTTTISGTPGYADAAITTVTITANDGLLTDDAVFDIAIAETNRPPAIDSIPDVVVAEGVPLLPVVVTAGDPDATIPALSATGLPPWAAFVDNLDGTGTITGIPGFTDAATHAVTVTADDGSLTHDAAFTLTVTNTNRPPVVAPMADQTVAETDAFVLIASATDPDLTVPFMNVAGLPGWASFTDNGDGTASVSGTPGYFDAGSSLITITATDGGALSGVEALTLTVADTNRPPVVDPISDQSTPEAAPFTLTITASDPDGTSPSLTAVGLPAWVTLTDNGDGIATLAGTPGFTDAASHLITITANDGTLTDDESLTLTITNTNRAPVITDPGPQITPEGALFGVILTASDPDGTVVAFADGGTLPGWATLTDNGDNTADISGTPAYTDSGITTVTVTVSDGLLPADAVFDIAVTNTNRPPVVDPVADQVTAETVPLTPLVVSASDSDGTIPALSAAGLPPWATFTDNADGTGTLTGTPGYFGSGKHVITVTADDGSLTHDTTFTLTVTNTNRAPEATDDALLIPSDLGSAEFTVLTNDSDPDGDPISITSFDPTTTGTLTAEGGGLFRYTPGSGAPYAETFTYTIADTAGATATATVYLSVTVPAPLPPIPIVELPALIGLAPINGVELDPIAFTADITQPAEVRFALIGGPAGASINAATGAFSWTPSEGQGPGDYTLLVRITDPEGAVLDEASVAVSVLELETAPRLRPSGPFSTEPGATLTVTFRADDADLPAVPPRFGLSGDVPPGATINPGTGVLIWNVPSDHLIGRAELIVRVVDGSDPTLHDQMTITVTVGASSSSDRKAALVAGLFPATNEPRDSTPVARTETGVKRTLVIMARAGMGSAQAFGAPFLLLALLTVMVVAFGRVSIHPLLGRSERKRGTVAWFDTESGYGFIIPDRSAEELFIHRTSLGRGKTAVAPGDRVTFRTVKGSERSFALGVEDEGES